MEENNGMNVTRYDLSTSLANARTCLLQERNPHGHWDGELSSSALSTATAVVALSLTDPQKYQQHIHQGLQWLNQYQNKDGGWGDSILSPSNISTTTLAWAAYAVAEDESIYTNTIKKAEQWIKKRSGQLDIETLADAITACYGEDRTFSVPILTHCVLSGKFGSDPKTWSFIKPLPFELALAPFCCLKWLRITVVSYALPALIAIGQVRHHYAPPKNPFVRFIRNIARPGTLNLLRTIQPDSGGFLEATPLTSFVTMSLVSSGHKDHLVVKKATEFLTRSQRNDGSWPIDSNLTTWGTTLSVNALAMNKEFKHLLSEKERASITSWLLNQQNRGIHPYTRAGAGGWAWTDLPGGVPDADDTAGALIALYNLGIEKEAIKEAVQPGIQWFLQLQNNDGGIPTFCRGWGKLPFDRSAPDLTAHFISALSIWSQTNQLPEPLNLQIKKSIRKSLHFLKTSQQDNGSWIPLWFGNPHAPNEENPVYGTSLVTTSLVNLTNIPDVTLIDMVSNGHKYILETQNTDQGWGGSCNTPSSIEETALAICALSQVLAWSKTHEMISKRFNEQQIINSIKQGTAWLLEKTHLGTEFPASPIGLYFARLWYFEKLYPIIFTTRALELVNRMIPLLFEHSLFQHQDKQNVKGTTR